VHTLKRVPDMVGLRGLHTLCGLASLQDSCCWWRVLLALDSKARRVHRQLTLSGVNTF